MNNYRFDGIQALRFLAAIMVVFTHSIFYASERLGQGVFSWGVGAKGVDIFFVISGFVMVISSRFLVSSKDGWKEFIQKRLVRIVPLYWAATTFKLVVILLISSLVLHAKLDWWIIAKSYFFIPSHNLDGEIKPFLGVGWTLVFEMFFYLVFSISLFLRKNIYLFVGIVLLIFSMLSLFRGVNYSPWWFLMDPIILEFYAGMIIGYFTLKDKLVPKTLSLITLAVSLAYLFYSPNALGLPRILESGVPSAMLVWSIISLEIYLQGKIPRSIMFYGAASYALYLFHPVVAPLAPEVLKKLSIGIFPVSVLLSVIIAMTAAAVVHRWVELPATQLLRNRIRDRIHTKKHITNRSTRTDPAAYSDPS